MKKAAKVLEKKVFLMPFSHLDLFWLGNRHECLSRGNFIFLEAMRLCKKSKDFRFLIEDAVFLEHFIRSYPEKLTELKKLVKAGQIELAAKWAAIMITNVDGETVVRDILYGQKSVEDIFGIRTAYLHLGDLPGYCCQLPQMANQSGVEGIIICRGGPAKTPFFYWLGIDGSKTLSWYTPYCYNWGVDFGLPKDEFEKKYPELSKQVSLVGGDSAGHIFMHYGWDLAVQTDNCFDNVTGWNAKDPVKMQFSTQEEFFKACEKIKNVPTLAGEIPTVWSSWPDAAYLDVTINHAFAENELLWAEQSSALDMLEKNKFDSKTNQQLESAWKYLLQSLDHNYSASAAYECHQAKNSLTIAASQISADISTQQLAKTCDEIVSPKNHIPIAVFNPSSFSRDAVINQRVLFYSYPLVQDLNVWTNLELIDDKLQPVEFQVDSDFVSATIERQIVFKATDVPALGYRTYYLKERSGKLTQPQPKQNIDKESVTVSAKELNASVGKNGIIKINHIDGSPLVEKMYFRAVEQSQTNQVMQMRTTGKTFDFSIDSFSAVVDGPIYCQLELKGKIADCPFVVKISVPKKLEYVEVSTKIDWPADKFVRFQLVCELAGKREGQTYIGVPFGANKIENVIPGCGPNLPDEVEPDIWPNIREAQNWFLTKGSNSKYGLAVASQRKLIEFSENGFAINILSGMTAKWIKPKVVFHPFAGTFESSFRFQAQKADDIVSAAKFGRELFQPLKSFCSYSVSNEKTRPPVFSGISINKENVILTSIKPAADGRGVIVRFLETGGRQVTVSVKITGFKKNAWLSNLLEDKIKKANPVKLGFKPFEIKTLRLEI